MPNDDVLSWSDDKSSAEEIFHEEQEKIFQQMSRLFALGSDQEAIQLREKLKQNVTAEYNKLTAELDYAPPRLAKIKEEMRLEIQGLTKSLEENDKDSYKALSAKLWDLRYEMEEVEHKLQDHKDLIQEKISDFRNRYGSLVPSETK